MNYARINKLIIKDFIKSNKIEMKGCQVQKQMKL